MGDACVRRRRRIPALGPAYVTTGLTAYWDSTAQNGSEGSVVDTVGGLNATHTGSPTYDATAKLWSYNGTTQKSITSLTSALQTTGVFTLESVVQLISTTPNFGYSSGIAITGGVQRIVFEATASSWTAVIVGGTNTSYGTMTMVGTLVHLAITSDGTHTQIYKNGTAVGAPVAYTPPAVANLLAGFGSAANSSQWCNCKAGWMRYYAATALASAQIAQNYAHAKTLFPTLP